MTGYKEEYKERLNLVQYFKENTMDAVVKMIKTISVKPLHIGNHWFFYVKHKGKEVPAYCHQKDYKEGAKFLPIYDEDNTGKFGWSDFSECCRIFDVIRKHLLK